MYGQMHNTKGMACCHQHQVDIQLAYHSNIILKFYV